MNKQSLKTFLLIVCVTFVGISTSGCIKVKNENDTSGVDGGVFRTLKRGATWNQKNLIKAVGGANPSLAGTNYLTFETDPSDPLALYYATLGNGTYYTYDGGESWERISKLGNYQVRSISVDPNSKCVIYVAINNRIQKTIDCGRTWFQVYYDNNVAAIINKVEVDHYDSQVIYVGLSRGEILKSFDGGATWRTLNKFKGAVKDIVIDKDDSRVVFAVTDRYGVHYTLDAGQNWFGLDTVMNEFNIGADTRDFSISYGDNKTYYLATTNGIIRSKDLESGWERVNTILTKNEIGLRSMAINYEDPNFIYYVTDTTFYASMDGGENWATKKLPTTRAGRKLMMSTADTDALFLGVQQLRK